MHQSSSVAGYMPEGSTAQWNVVMRCQHAIYLLDTSMLSPLMAFHTSFNMDVPYLSIVFLEITHLGNDCYIMAPLLLLPIHFLGFGIYLASQPCRVTTIHYADSTPWKVYPTQRWYLTGFVQLRPTNKTQ